MEEKQKVCSPCLAGAWGFGMETLGVEKTEEADEVPGTRVRARME